MESARIPGCQRPAGGLPDQTLEKFGILPLRNASSIERNRIVTAWRKSADFEKPVVASLHPREIPIERRGPAGAVLREHDDDVVLDAIAVRIRNAAGNLLAP